ncbi:MAG: PQQ-binding-like beta-propeller repeat protein [Akkermansiaceae bacterium]|nr:PQQ-binding-like beta-propeller repeat protein [Akkermansiaceae bacterium]NNM30329.1 PQQ-binding-like beta-propeller repeat protein [Akkermansiaceae bacterium]
MRQLLLWIPILACVGCDRDSGEDFDVPETPLSDVEELSVPDSFDGIRLAPPASGDWPWWRGAGRNGRSKDSRVPVEWAEGRNVLWKAPIAGQGHSSPIVVGTKLFLTTADRDAETQSVLALDRETGRQIWDTVVHRGGMSAALNKKATFADCTLASSGDQLFALFLNDGGLHVSALDMDGKIQWQTRVGPFNTKFGYGSSPVLFESFVIVAGDDPQEGYLAALHRKTGKVMWRTARKTTKNGSYGTPLLVEVDDDTQLVINGTWTVAGYNPRTGEQLWSVDSPAEASCNTMAAGKDFVYASGGTPKRRTMCVRPDATLEPGTERVVWTEDRASATCYVPSLLWHDGMLFNLYDQGILSCFDGRTGEVHWRKRLGGNFSASPVYAAGHLYLCSEEGTTYVVRASPDYKRVAVNELDSGFMASPAICGGRIYLRTKTHVYCISKS